MRAKHHQNSQIIKDIVYFHVLFQYSQIFITLLYTRCLLSVHVVMDLQRLCSLFEFIKLTNNDSINSCIASNHLHAKNTYRLVSIEKIRSRYR